MSRTTHSDARHTTQAVGTDTGAGRRWPGSPIAAIGRRQRTAWVAGSIAISAALVGCGERDPAWDAPTTLPLAFALDRSVALVDVPAGRVVMGGARADLQLDLASYALPTGYAHARVTPDGERLLALCRGDVPRRSAEDAPPVLAVYGGGEVTPVGPVGHYELSDPLSAMAVDPLSRYAVVYASAEDASAFLQNPNELIVVDLERGASADNPFPLTVRSFGGTPERLTFTPELSLPGGARRLLVIETDRDVTLVDLDHLDVPEITVKLTSGGEAPRPSGVAVSDGDPDPATTDDGRIAIRLQSDSSIVLVDLLPVPEAEQAQTPQSFRAQPNVVVVGGPPSDIAFVQTDGGLRLAALVPSRQVLSLVDPVTGIASEVELGAPFDRLSLVTDVVGATGLGSDVALLWSSSSPRIAFVALGSTVGRPYRSVELLELERPVAEVVAVPPPNEHLRLLTDATGYRFVVLDLLARTASPIHSTQPGTRLHVAPNGLRAWLYAQGSSLGQLDLATLHPRNVSLSYPIHGVFDIARDDGGRAVVAVHPVGATALTVLDGAQPSLADAREYVGVLLGDLP